MVLDVKKKRKNPLSQLEQFDDFGLLEGAGAIPDSQESHLKNIVSQNKEHEDNVTEKIRDIQAAKSTHEDPGVAYKLAGFLNDLDKTITPQMMNIKTGEVVATPGDQMMKSWKEEHKARAESLQEKAKSELELQKYIHESRKKTQDILRKFFEKREDTDFKREQLGLQREIADETRRHHMTTEESARTKEGATGATNSDGKEILTPSARTKLINEAQNSLKSARKLMETTKKMGALLDSGKVKGGRNAGRFKDWSGLMSDEEAGFDSMSNELLLNAHQAMKNIPRSEGFMELLKTTKPGLRQPNEVSRSQLKTFKDAASEADRMARYNLARAGFSEDKIDHLAKTVSGNVPDEEDDERRELEALRIKHKGAR